MGKSRIETLIDIANETNSDAQALGYLREALVEAERIEHESYICLINDKLKNYE